MPVKGWDGKTVGFADGKGGVHPEPGQSVMSPSGIIIGFTDGMGGVGGSETILKMYERQHREMFDDVKKRIDSATSPVMGDARTGGVVRGGGAGAGGHEVTHTLTAGWISANLSRDRASGAVIRRDAMEGVLRVAGVAEYFRVSDDGTAVEPRLPGCQVQFKQSPQGDIELKFMW